MKKSFFLIFYLFCIFCSANCNNKIDFSLITDTNIPHEEENLISELKNNVLVAKEKGKEVSRYYSSNGNILTIESINNNIIKLNSEKNTYFENTVGAPSWDEEYIYLLFENNSFKEIVKYKNNKGLQNSHSIELINENFSLDKIILIYEYQYCSGVKPAGYGNIKLELTKLKNGLYYLTGYNSDVAGHFNVYEENGEEIWIPSENGNTIDPREVCSQDFMELFFRYNNTVIYDISKIGNNCLVYENLRLRRNETTSSEIIKTMKAGEFVQILDIGKEEVIDSIPGNWVYIEIIEPVTAWDINPKIKNSGIKGWCFSGYLK